METSHKIRRGLLAQPFEYSFAMLCLLVGASIAITGFIIPSGPSTYLPRFIGIAWAVALLGGGSLLLTGLQWRGREELSRGLELSGLILVGSMWATFSLVVILAAPSAYMQAAQGIAMIVGCIGRGIQLARVERAVVRVSKVAKAG